MSVILNNTGAGYATTPKFRWFRLVRHEHVTDYLRCGWHIAQHDLLHHSYYSVLLEWLCDCNIVEPKNVRESAIPVCPVPAVADNAT